MKPTEEKLDSTVGELSPEMILTGLRCSAKTQRQTMDILIRELREQRSKYEFRTTMD